MADQLPNISGRYIRRGREIRFKYREKETGRRMRSGVKQTGPLGGEPPVRRANRRLNGMGNKCGLPDPPIRGRLARTIALVDAALRVWEANQPRQASVWRNCSRQ